MTKPSFDVRQLGDSLANIGTAKTARAVQSAYQKALGREDPPEGSAVPAKPKPTPPHLMAMAGRAI